MRELELRIGALSRRNRVESESFVAKDIRYFPGTLKVQSADGQQLTLSGISANLFEILIRAYPNYVKHQALIEQVWGDDFVDPHTLRSHVSALRRSLKVGLGRSLVQSIHGKGYCLNPDSEK